MWCPRSNMLWFTDIKGGRLHRFNLLTKHHSSFTVDGQPGFVLPADDGALVVGMGQALYRFANGVVTHKLLTIPMDARNRLNNGTVDGHWRRWFAVPAGR